MDSHQILKNKILSNKAKIGVIGLGYVGLPLAIAFAKRGFFVYGFDNNRLRIDKLKKSKQYIVDIEPREVTSLIRRNKFVPTTDSKVLADCDILIVCVPTPLRKVKIPDISYVVGSAKIIKKYLRKSQLIILESTSYPTTTREVVLPILKQSGLEPEKDFFLCFSPERINPGDKKFTLAKIAKIVGGLSSKSGSLAKTLYLKIIKQVFKVSSPEVAECSKLLENTFRLVNIALVSEFTIVAEKLGISIWEVIEAAKTKPFGFMPFYPGPGIGGHCIPDDPVYLSWKAKKMGFKTKMVDLASYIGHFMPKYVVQRTKEILSRKGISLKGAKILVLGVTYKKDVKDLRESPALDIIEELQRNKSTVGFYDPLISHLKIGSINLKREALVSGSLKKYDCLVVVTDHSGLDYQFLQKHSKQIFDTRNVYKRKYSNVEVL